jgi:hypothetical protein
MLLFTTSTRSASRRELLRLGASTRTRNGCNESSANTPIKTSCWRAIHLSANCWRHHLQRASTASLAAYLTARLLSGAEESRIAIDFLRTGCAGSCLGRHGFVATLMTRNGSRVSFGTSTHPLRCDGKGGCTGRQVIRAGSARSSTPATRLFSSPRAGSSTGCGMSRGFVRGTLSLEIADGGLAASTRDVRSGRLRERSRRWQSLARTPRSSPRTPRETGKRREPAGPRLEPVSRRLLVRRYLFR